MILVKGWYIRRPGIVAVAVNLTIAAGIVILVQAIIRSTVSESQEISLFLKKILPAGNCLCQSSTTFDCKLSSSEATTYENGGRELSASLESGWRFQFGRDDLNLGMSDSQCMSAFPGLFEDIYRAVALRLDQNTYVSAHDLNSIELSRGMVRAMIVERKLVVLESQHMDQDHRKKGLATLQAIQRSISISGKSLPNIEFVFSIEDMVQNLAEPLWTLARRPQDENLWLMPDFGFWSWDIEDLGPFDSVVQRVIRDEINVPWPVKIQKLVWRGALRRAPKLRRALLDACRDKTWSDVEVLVETAPSIFGNYVSAADQCKYMFLAHAEGRSYSGSLKYRQVCNSVVIIHKMQWIQHHHYLFVANGKDQNYVEVERDFSDLERVMEHLLAHPEEAQRIANNSVRTFRERYLTVAAEACYWRALIQGWASVSFKPEIYERSPDGELSERPRGMRFENFALLESDKQMNFVWK